MVIQGELNMSELFLQGDFFEMEKCVDDGILGEMNYLKD